MRKQIVEYTTQIDALIALVKMLKTYENQYQMESEDFFDQYSQGLLSDDEDFMEWAGNYQHFLAIRQEIIDIAAKYGASNIRVFGSYARRKQTPDSDLDLLIDLQKGISLFDRIALKQELEDLLGVKVDIAKPENLHEIIREKVLDEAIPL